MTCAVAPRRPLGEQPSFPPDFRREFGVRIRPILDHLREKGCWMMEKYGVERKP